MNILRLSYKGFIYNWRLSFCLLLGTLLASSILTGSLLVGDSVKKTLKSNAFERIGKIHTALSCGDRFITDDYVETLSQTFNDSTISGILKFPGTLSTPDKTKRSNSISINGVDSQFWKFFENQFVKNDYIAINETLAKQKNLNIGDRVIIKYELPGHVSKDAPLSGDTEKIGSISGKITDIIKSNQGGQFNILAEQKSTLNVFVPLNYLQEESDKVGKCNLLLTSKLDNFNAAINSHWTIDDLELNFRDTHEGFTELISQRVFISEVIEDTVRKIHKESEPIISYLVNDIKHKGYGVPYSVGTGIGKIGSRLLGVTTPLEDEIILNNWLADKTENGGIDVKIGDVVNLTYYAVTDSREFKIIGDGLNEQKENDPNDILTFKVKDFIDKENEVLTKKWVPDFPGLETATTLASWESGMPLDTKKIRDSDELYWEKYRSTPKVFINSNYARMIWGNRFGKCTSILINDSNFDQSKFTQSLRSNIELTDLGMNKFNVFDNAVTSYENSLDFGSLFASLSGFLILSSFLICFVLSTFAVESKSVQLGALRSFGFTIKKIRAILTIELLLPLFIGAFLGLLGGTFYTKMALIGFSSIWSDAAVGVDFVYGYEFSSFVIAFTSIVFFSYIVTRIAINKTTKITPKNLLNSSAEDNNIEPNFKSPVTQFILVIVCFAIGLILIYSSKFLQGEKLAGAFFGSGFLILLGFIITFSIYLKKSNKLNVTPSLNLFKIGSTNASRKRGRSLSIISTVSLGIFLVLSVNAFRLGDEPTDSNVSGTGGFEFYATSTLPIYENLNDPKVRDKFGLEDYSLNDLKFYPLRTLANSEEASCQNLSHANNPRILGVNPSDLSERNSFRFSSTHNQLEKNTDSPWSLLESKFSENLIPAIGDKASVMWAMKKNIGDTVPIIDGNGNEQLLLLVGLIENSILQGSLAISEDHFLRLYPNSGGFNTFLIESTFKNETEIAEDLTKALELRGFDLINSNLRLQQYSNVQNTYISIFSVLGGLGVLVGTLGVGIIIVRGVFERQKELSVMRAIGFNKSKVKKIVLYEHLFLVSIGSIIGIVSALITISPSSLSASQHIPIKLLSSITIIIVLGSFLFCYLATTLTIKGKLLKGIRTE